MHCVLMLLFLWFSSRGKLVLAEEVRQVVAQHIRALGPASPDEMSIEFRKVPDDIQASSETYELRVIEDGHPALKGNVTLPVELLCHGAVERRFTVSVKIRRFGDALFAVRQLPQHAQLSGEDVLVQRVETTNLPGDIITRESKLQGMRTKRIISRGGVLRENMFETQPLVKPEDNVNFVVTTKTVRISVHAVAREDGREGDVVGVVRQGSRGMLKGKVVDQRTVELKLD